MLLWLRKSDASSSLEGSLGWERGGQLDPLPAKPVGAKRMRERETKKACEKERGVCVGWFCVCTCEGVRMCVGVKVSVLGGILEGVVWGCCVCERYLCVHMCCVCVSALWRGEGD